MRHRLGFRRFLMLLFIAFVLPPRPPLAPIVISRSILLVVVGGLSRSRSILLVVVGGPSRSRSIILSVVVPSRSIRVAVVPFASPAIAVLPIRRRRRRPVRFVPPRAHARSRRAVQAPKPRESWVLQPKQLQTQIVIVN